MPSASPISSVNDFVIRFANVNGSGSASANELFARAILRMGVPVSPRNIFPSNIQGLPTWYEVRVTEAGHLGARGGIDLMVAMNPQTFDRDVAVDRAGRLSAVRLHQADPDGAVSRGHHRHRRAADRDLQSRPIRTRASASCSRTSSISARSRRCSTWTCRRSRSCWASNTKARKSCWQPNIHALHLGRDWALENLQCPHRTAAQARQCGRRSHLRRGQRGGGAWRRLWRRHRLRLVSDHAIVLAGGSLHALLRALARRCRSTARTNTRSCRRRTSSHPSALSSARPGTARARSRRPRGQASR